MRRRTALILATIAVVPLYWTANGAWKTHQRNRRQHQYEATLASYRGEFKVNTARIDIESILGKRGITPTHEPYGGPPLDDFIKLGREQDVWYCNWENEDLQFKFNSSEPRSTFPKPQDTLQEITLSQWAYDCL
jgi:hypothetical protein